MKERPILFSGPLVRAILGGTKTQTRRVVKWRTLPWATGTNLTFSGLSLGNYCTGKPESGWVLRTMRDGCWNDVTRAAHSPYGKPGDRLWVRETWRPWERPEDGVDGIEFAADSGFRSIGNTREAASRWVDVNDRPGKRGRWRPSIHMPRWASRINLEVTGVRVERVQEVTGEDVVAEGIELPIDLGDLEDAYDEARTVFAALWDRINQKRGYPWASNPWVWVVEFRRVRP